MMIKIISTSKEKLVTFLIVSLMVFSPYTELRLFSLFGVPEFCLIILIIYTFVSYSGKNFVFWGRNKFIFTKFWIVFVLLSVLGSVTNLVFFFPPSGTVSSLLFDSATYGFLTLGFFTLELLYQKIRIDNLKVLFSIFTYSSLLLFILFIVSRFTSSLFGMKIMHYHFFRPFASNIHHISMFVGPLPFIGLYYLMQTPNKNIVKKFMILVFVISNYLIGINTGSYKFQLGMVVGIIAFFVFIILSRIEKSKDRILIFLLSFIVILFLITINFSLIVNFLVNTFREEDIGSGRENIYLLSLNAFLRSPIFGYGPGAHAKISSSHYMDAHQTLLTILLQAGPAALLLYLTLWWKIIFSFKKNLPLLASCVPIFVYALGGDVVRRLPMWIYLFLLYNINFKETGIANEKSTICRNRFLS